MGTPPMFANIESHIRNIFIGNVPKILEEKRKQYISSVDMAPTILQPPDLIGEALNLVLEHLFFQKINPLSKG